VNAAMPSADELDACYERTAERCAEEGYLAVRPLPTLTDSTNLAIQVDVASRRWIIEVDCSWPRLTSLPTVRLVNHDSHLAHVGYNGVVCVNDNQGLSIDPSRQADAVAETVLAAIALLERSAGELYGGNHEFYNELEGYWGGLPHGVAGRTYVEVDERDRFIVSHFDRVARSPAWYFVEPGDNTPPEFDVSRLPAMRALHFALDNAVSPPLPGKELDATYITELLSTLSPSQTALWERLVSSSAKTKSKVVALLMSVPRAAGGRSLLGVSFSIRAGRIDPRGKITPIVMFRHTATYMRERGGAPSSVSGKHVVVVGCGSVGSEIADALASSGVGFLTLVDPEALSEDNVFRHVLGRCWITQAKVHGLRKELMTKYPGVVVARAVMDAQTWFAQSELKDVDGIVFALGMPSLERALAMRLRSSETKIPIVHTWLEPLDLGGHSVLLMNSGEGCFECLFRDDEGTPALVPQTAFLAPGQHVSKNITGCASIFVPYGAIQSRRTSLLAAEQMLSALAKHDAPAYEFWVGAGSAAKMHGLKTTNWWERAKSASTEAATRQLFGRPCSHCRGTA
jgi:molybdopterin/thiamine biosynthesis adenylyltransferase